MKVRDSVFDSAAEADGFRRIASQWSPRFNVQVHLPLTNLIELDPAQLSAGERRTFFSTSVDYTLCDQRYRPILSIEFDGIGGGYRRDGVYVQQRETPDPHRKLKMDFKLEVTREAGYPLLVVSYEEFESLEEDESVTILDGIIGAFFAHRTFNERVEGVLQKRLPSIEHLSEPEQREVIQDWVMEVDTDCELTEDPLAEAAARYSLRFSELGGTHASTTALYDPPPPDLEYSGAFPNPADVIRRIAAMGGAHRVGARVLLRAGRVTVMRNVWIRNNEVPGVRVESVASTIAEYLAAKQACRLLSAQQEAR